MLVHTSVSKERDNLLGTLSSFFFSTLTIAADAESLIVDTPAQTQYAKLCCELQNYWNGNWSKKCENQPGRRILNKMAFTFLKINEEVKSQLPKIK